jgi:CubicO group peptidase (beta-lactamase class C family)
MLMNIVRWISISALFGTICSCASSPQIHSGSKSTDRVVAATRGLPGVQPDPSYSGLPTSSCANLSQDPSLQELKPCVQETLARDLKTEGQVAIMMAVIKDGKSATWGFGHTSVDSNKKPGKHTYFEIASVGKIYATPLLALEAVKCRVVLGTTSVRTEDPAAQYCPELKGHSPTTIKDLWPDLQGTFAGKITLLQLATFTSGLPDDDVSVYFGANPSDPAHYSPYKHYDADRLLKFLKAYTPPTNGPYPIVYSNLGMGLLGYLLSEKLNHQSFELYLQDNLLEPLEMHETKITLNQNDIAHSVISYDSVQDVVPVQEMGVLYAAGGEKVTASDIIKFMRFQMAEENSDPFCKKNSTNLQLCRAANIAQMPWVETPAPSSQPVAMVWDVINYRYGADKMSTLVYKNGANSGSTASLAIDPARKIGVALFASTPVRPDAIWLPVFGTKAPAPTYSSFNVDDMNAYEGTYLLTLPNSVKVSASIGVWNGIFGIAIPPIPAIQFSGELPARLLPTSQASSSTIDFTTADDDAFFPVQFIPGSGGAPAKIIVQMAGQTVPLERQ